MTPRFVLAVTPNRERRVLRDGCEKLERVTGVGRLHLLRVRGHELLPIGGPAEVPRANLA